MKTLVVYGTKTEVTEDCAKELSKLLTGETALINVKKVSKINLNDYDRIVIGTSIYFGTINSKIKNFCIENNNILLTKPLAIYTCGISKNDEALVALDKGISKELINHSKIISHFNGEARLKKLNPVFKFILKKVVVSAYKSVDNFSIYKNKIVEFANTLNK